ncbi:MAG: hypothetical protein WAL50_02040 [Kineosporiaceae bacterium]
MTVMAPGEDGLMRRATIEGFIWKGNRSPGPRDRTPGLLTTAGPFCIVMLTDGVHAVRSENCAGPAGEVASTVTDIAEVLLRSCVGTAMTELVEGTTR